MVKERKPRIKNSLTKPRFGLYLLIALIGIGLGVGLSQYGPSPALKLQNTPTYAGKDSSVPNSNLADLTLTGQNPVVPIAQEVSPAVVGITTIQGLGILSKNGEESTGSGVIFDAAQGFIVTNNHVVDGASYILVTLADGREIPANLLGRDAHTDLAVLQIKAPNLVAVTFGDSDQVRVGEAAIAIGNPLGIQFARSVTLGVISGINRELTSEETSVYPLLQTDAAINPGNSGGALLNSQGEVIGINTVKIVIPGFEGMGFAIPSNQVKNVIAALVQNKEIIRPTLGVQARGEVTTEAATYYQLPVEYGVVVTLDRTGPARKAGMQDYDVIIAVDNQAIHSAVELRDLVLQHQVGDQVQVTVLRQKKTKETIAYREVVIPVRMGILRE